MIHRIGRKKYQIYGFDLESHNDSESIAKNETSMWLGCLIDENSKIDDEDSYLYSINDFITKIEQLTAPKKRKNTESIKCKNLCIYIYNLSFEWSFILPALLERGFKAVAKIGKDDEYVFSSVTTKSVSSVWDVRIQFSKKHGSIIIKDLAKIYGGGLRKVAESFKLETQKGEMDYTLNRLHGHIVTKEEKEYCFKDTRILIEILLKLIDDKEFWNVSSIASYSMKHLLQAGFKNSHKPYRKFREMYPELDEEETKFLRAGVEGGITYATPRFQFIPINQRIYHIDIHQAHPFSAWKHLYPYGKGEYFTGEPRKGKINCCRVKIGYDGVYLHSVIKLIGIDYIEDYEITLWDFEIALMRRCYKNFRVQYIDGYAYKMRFLPWRDYYAENYKARLIAKKSGDAFNTMRYKLLNNSSYGKLLEKPHNQILLNTINGLGIIDSIVENKPENEVKVNAKYTYLPVGSAIPAWTRVYLVSTALRFSPDGSKICYFDTDSIFILWDEEVEKIWQSTDINKEDWLGGWDLEETLSNAMFTAPKRYKTLKEGKTGANIKAGGINFDNYIEVFHQKEVDNLLKQGYSKSEAIKQVEIPFDEINITDSSWQVQRAMRCKGGTLIVFQEKKMSVQKKYKDIYERNTKADNI